ncbi:MAG: RecX family transcriptional regulator [Marinilabiliales bacterium]|nr:MAG: RecX family transcriptional regulator [Marinilabiliales bacterium]
MLTKEQFESRLQRAKNICSRSEKCSFDIKQYLSKFEISELEIDKIINILIKEKYIDDSRYTQFYVNDKLKFNKWGKIKIRYSLNQKGISTAIINQSLNKIDEHLYLETLKNIILHKNKGLNKRNNIHAKAALVRFASSRGFEYDLIMKIVNELYK